MSLASIAVVLDVAETTPIFWFTLIGCLVVVALAFVYVYLTEIRQYGFQTKADAPEPTIDEPAAPAAEPEV